MRRLEYERRIRTAPGHARNAAEAVMFLAAVARERHRLGQEQRSLVKRMQRIEARLTAIAATETKLVPMIQVPGVQSPPRAAASRTAGMTLQY
jgi:hypothetical protein